MPRIRSALARNVTMRAMIWQADYHDVSRIEGASYPTPWKPSFFNRYLKSDGVVARVLQYQTVIRGYYIIKLFRRYAEIANFTVDPLFRNIGLGTKLFADLMQRTIEARREEVSIFIAECELLSAPETTPFMRFVRSCGMRARRCVRPGEDGCDIPSVELYRRLIVEGEQS